MSSLQFADAAKRLGQAARSAGYEVPSFRSPPRRPGCTRSITRRANATTVSVALHGRPLAAVVADMIDGIIVTNELGDPDAGQLRDLLWAAASSMAFVKPDAEATHHLAA